MGEEKVRKSMWPKKELLNIKIYFLIHVFKQFVIMKSLNYFDRQPPLSGLQITLLSSVQMMLLLSSSIRFFYICHLPYISPDIIFVNLKIKIQSKRQQALIWD